MTADQRAIWLFGGVIALLAVASLIGAILSARAKSDEKRAVIDNLNARTKAWWVMVAVFGVAFVLGGTATLVLFALASFFALREFITLTPTRPGDHLPLVLSFFVLIPLQYALIGHGQYGTFAILIPVYAFLLLPAIATFAADTEDFLARSAKLQWAIMICIYCISYAPALLLRLLEEVARHFVGGVGYQVVYGAVIILFIVFLPRGLVGGLTQLFRRRRKPAARTQRAGVAS